VRRERAWLAARVGDRSEAEGSGIPPGGGICEHRTARRGGEGEGQRHASPSPAPSFWVVAGLAADRQYARGAQDQPTRGLWIAFRLAQFCGNFFLCISL
jgi:hypothetical protein